MVARVPAAVPTRVLVEGASDRVAVVALARRRGHDLSGVEVVELGGATNAGRWLADHGREGRVLGLYDAPEERFFRRGLERAGLGVVPDREELERRGFFACDPDLEDELLRAVGERGVLRVIEEQGELPSLRVLQHQPAQRGRSQHDHLRRFLSSQSGRKAAYAEALVAALDLDAAPPPLVALLERIWP